MLWSSVSGYMIGTVWRGSYEPARVDETFEETKRANVNIIHPRMAVLTLVAPLRTAKVTLTNVQYASPKPAALEKIIKRMEELKTS